MLTSCFFHFFFIQTAPIVVAIAPIRHNPQSNSILIRYDLNIYLIIFVPQLLSYLIAHTVQIADMDHIGLIADINLYP